MGMVYTNYIFNMYVCVKRMRIAPFVKKILLKNEFQRKVGVLHAECS